MRHEEEKKGRRDTKGEVEREKRQDFRELSGLSISLNVFFKRQELSRRKLPLPQRLDPKPMP